MALDTKDEIQQYLLLESKTNEELRAICEGMELSTEGERKELISRLLGEKIVPQIDFMLPQLIALRTKLHGQVIPGSEELMKLIRKTIFDGTTNRKEFGVLNEKNQPFKMVMKYARCSPQTLKTIFEKNMIYPLASQRELVKIIQKEPNVFHFNLVQRAYGKNKTFIMLHCQPKVA